MKEAVYLGLVPTLGPSKNYVTAREGEGVDEFVTYCYVFCEGEGGILCNCYVTANRKFQN